MFSAQQSFDSAPDQALLHADANIREGDELFNAVITDVTRGGGGQQLCIPTPLVTMTIINDEIGQEANEAYEDMLVDGDH